MEAYEEYSRSLHEFNSAKTRSGISESFAKLISSKYASYFKSLITSDYCVILKLGNNFPGTKGYELVQDVILDVFGYESKELYGYTISNMRNYEATIKEGELKYWRITINSQRIILRLNKSDIVRSINEAMGKDDRITREKFLGELLPLLYNTRFMLNDIGAGPDGRTFSSVVKRKLEELRPLFQDSDRTDIPEKVKMIDKIIEIL